MGNIIAIFEYKKTKYIIKFIEEKRIGFFRIDDLGNLNDKLTLEERKALNEVYRSLQINLKNSVFYSTYQIEKNNYNIYYDNSTQNYFWLSANKIYNSDDNIKLNFKYNHELGIVFSDINNNPFKGRKNMFNKIIKINGKLVLVFVSASLTLSMLSGCAVSESKLEESYNESYAEQSNSSIVDGSSEVQFEIEEQNIPKEYNFEDIKNILENNPHLSQEEKDLICKLQFVFDEYHSFMDLEVIRERLVTLSIDYQKEFFSSTGGYYDYVNNKLVLNAENFEEISKGKFLHEFFHVLQKEVRGYGYFSCELSNEFFTREVLLRLYKEGILGKEEFIHPYYKNAYKNDNLQIDSENEWLNFINMNSGFGEGYSDYMSIYYVLAQIVPKETLLSYQFNPLQTEELKRALLRIVGNTNSEEIERSNNLINSINDLREYDTENNSYVYLKDDGNIFAELDYYYKIAKGKSISEDFLLCVQLCDMDCQDFGIQSYLQDVKTFLRSKGICYLGFGASYSTFSLNKTILSDAQEESIIVYMEDEEIRSLVIDESLQNEYISFSYTSQIKK